jgi:FlaA1/EpsC-like NDP-sugar epimerase
MGFTVMDKSHPNGDIKIKIIGLRAGEKLYEELLIGDNPIKTGHPKIIKAHENFILWNVLEKKLNELEKALLLNDIKNIREILSGIVEGFSPDNTISDLLSED